MPTECSAEPLLFQADHGRTVVAKFDGAAMSSDGGVLLLREADLKAGILRKFARCFVDRRNPDRVEHSLESMLAQRVYGIALGYEDLNDHDDLRRDPLLAVAVGARDPGVKLLSGKSTLNRLELSSPENFESDRYKRIAPVFPMIDRFMVSTFLSSYRKAPAQVILDVDSTDDPVHGEQEGRYFHGYYDNYCYLPLYVFSDSGHVLLAKLLPGNSDPKKAAVSELERIINHIQREWPATRIIVRGDSGFMSEEFMSLCERSGVDFVFGFAKNSKLLKKIRRSMRKAEREHKSTGKSARVFQDLSYKTRRSWTRSRRVVAKAEHMDGGVNPRFVVTSISSKEKHARWIYEELYCKRGEMENRIKEQQLDMFSDRTSTTSLASNQLRLYLSSVAYMLMHALRRIALAGTEMAKSQCGTIRTKLLKIGALVRVTVRKVWVTLPRASPYADVFRSAHAALLRC